MKRDLMTSDKAAKKCFQDLQNKSTMFLFQIINNLSISLTRSSLSQIFAFLTVETFANS